MLLKPFVNRVNRRSCIRNVKFARSMRDVLIRVISGFPMMGVGTAATNVRRRTEPIWAVRSRLGVLLHELREIDVRTEVFLDGVHRAFEAVRRQLDPPGQTAAQVTDALVRADRVALADVVADDRLSLAVKREPQTPEDIDALIDVLQIQKRQITRKAAKQSRAGSEGDDDA